MFRVIVITAIFRKSQYVRYTNIISNAFQNIQNGRWQMYDIKESNIRGEHVLQATFSGEFDRKIVFQFIDIMAVYEDIYPKHKLLGDK